MIEKNNQMQANPNNRNRNDNTKNDNREDIKDDKSIGFPENHENINNNEITEKITQKRYKEIEEQLKQSRKYDIYSLIILISLFFIATIIAYFRTKSALNIYSK